MKINPLRLHGFCPLCAFAYDDQAVEFLSERGNVRIFHCGCKNCGHAILAFMMLEADWVRSVGFSTDLQKMDAKKFKGSSAITSEECIHFSEQLSRESHKLCDFLAAKKKADA